MPTPYPASIRRQPVMIEVLRHLAALFVIALPVNYLWELAQSPLYLPPSRLSDVLLHCFVASLGDGAIVGLIYGVCAILFRERDWYVRMSRSRWVAMLTAGLAVGVLVEWLGLRMQRWIYADTMPLIPGVQVGLVPILQMLVLPPLIFWVARAWITRRRVG